MMFPLTARCDALACGKKKRLLDPAPDFEVAQCCALTSSYLNSDAARIPAELAIQLARVEAAFANVQRELVDLRHNGGFRTRYCQLFFEFKFSVQYTVETLFKVFDERPPCVSNTFGFQSA